MASKRWIAMFSQTGSELREIIEEIGREPDIVITNNMDIDVMILPGKSSMQGEHQYLMRNLIGGVGEGDLITLHGYLGILPPEVVHSGAIIYNGHPGLITRYPDLKGRDPQQKFYENQYKYNYMGCVIHKVADEIDGGEIVDAIEMPCYARIKEYGEVLRILHNMSVLLWVDFLKKGELFE